MNKRSRKVRGSSRRLVALVLCCVCVLAALPVYALANEAATTPSTEASVQQTAGQAPDTPAQGTDTQSAGNTTQGTDTAPNPAADVNPSNSTPADETPSNSTPADETPSNSTPAADETPGNSTPAADETPSNSNPAADETPSNSTPADETPTEGSTQPEAPARRTVTATADGREFSVTGDLSATTTLRVVKLSSEAEAFIRDTVLQLGNQATGAAYDITLLDNGEEIQPEEAVEVSIIGLASAQEVYHLPHTSAADVVELVKKAAAQAKNAGRQATVSRNGRAMKNTPTYEMLTSSLTKGKLKFKTSGFSTYYFVFNNYNDPNNTNNDVNVITGLGKNKKDDYVYMAPGATLKYKADGDISDINYPQDAPITVNQQDNRTLIISANTDAVEGDQAYVVKWMEDDDECQLTIYVNGEKALDGILKGDNNGLQMKKLYISVRGDGSFPGEPADNSNDKFPAGTVVNDVELSGKPVYSYYTGNDYVANQYGPTTVFSDNAANFISPTIANHVDFAHSQNGTSTVGIVDETGAAIKQFILNNSINFDDFLDRIAAAGNVIATDQQRINKDNKNEYELVPYVIKLQADNGEGWHIDCIVKRKENVTLYYNINIPTDYEVQDKIVAPYGWTGAKNTTVDIDVIKKGDKLNDNVGTITVKPTKGNPDLQQEYTFTFKGWNTKPDGTGEWYYPDSMTGKPENGKTQITISEDTTLYAMWDTDPQLGKGNLRIAKVVSGTATGQEFEFKVSIALPQGSTDTEDTQYNYTVYDDKNISQSSDKIKSGGTLKLKAGQYAVISNLPSEATVTITETDAGNYTPSWSTGTATEGGGTSVTIKGGMTSQVTCTNTYTATAKVTIKKLVAGNMGSHNDSFTFTVSGTSVAVADQSFTLKHGGTKEITVNVGDTITVSETPGDYTASYAITATGAEATTGNANSVEYTVTNAADQLITFTNTYSVNIDTGVLLDTLPYLLILALVAGGVVVMLGRRRRRYED